MNCRAHPSAYSHPGVGVSTRTAPWHSDLQRGTRTGTLALGPGCVGVVFTHPVRVRSHR